MDSPVDDLHNFDTINAKQKLMLKDSPTKLFITYAIPSIITMLIGESAYIIDAWFVGNFIDANAFAAVSVIAPVWSILFGAAFTFSSGGVVLYATYIGQNNKKAALAVFTKIVLFLSVFMLVVTILGFVFTDKILYILGARGSVLAYAKEYYTYTIFFAFSYIFSEVLSAFLRAEGHFNIGILASLVALVVNIALDYICIVYTDMGIKGMSIASGVSMTISMLIYIGFNMYVGRELRLVTQVGKWRELISIAYNGISEAIGELSEGFMIIVFNRVLVWGFGNEGIASYALTQYFFAIIMTFAFGIGEGLSAVISTNNGANRIIRTRKILLVEIIAMGMISILVFLLATFSSDSLIGFFVKDVNDTLLYLSKEMLRYQRWAMLFTGLNIILIAYHTALRKAKISAILAVLQDLVLPIVFGISIWFLWGIKTVYITYPIVETTVFILALFMLFRLFRKQEKISM